MYCPRQIRNSVDLAAIINYHVPMTEEDATEGPIEWGGLLIPGGRSYEIDTEASSDTRCVLWDVNAAVDYKTDFHSCPLYHTMPEISRPHWCPAEYAVTEFFGGGGIVVLDWLEVYLSHGRHFEIESFRSIEAAREHYGQQCEWMSDYEREINAGQDDD